MTRWIGIFLLVAVGAAILGALCGYLIFKFYQKMQEKRQVMPLNKMNQFTIGTNQQTNKKIAAVAINEPSIEKEDAIEILLKTHKTPVTVEQAIKPQLSAVSSKPQIVSQNNLSVVDEQKQSAVPNVVNFSEITNQKNTSTPFDSKEPLKSIDSQLANYVNTTAEIPIKSPQPSVLEESVIVDQKQKTLVKVPKKTFKLSTHKELKPIKHKDASSLDETKNSPVSNPTNEPVLINRQISQTDGRQDELSKSDIIKELETNLAIATTPWSDKILPFQTSSWDSGHGEGEALLAPHIHEIIQLYIDIGLANNIVWMATEIGHRSKELDESYIRLCTNIAERAKKILSILKQY